MSTSCVIIRTGRLIASGKTALVLELVERLKAKGCEVVIVSHDEITKKEEEVEKVKICLSSEFGRFPEQAIKAFEMVSAGYADDAKDCLAGALYNWKRERDYPTLKQGLRDPKFRNKRR